MKFYFTATCKLTLEQNTPTTSRHISTDLRIVPSANLNQGKYLSRGLPTKDAVKPGTQCMVQGLIANIHMAHEKGWWDSAEHLRYIIKELEAGFSNAGARVYESTM